MKRIPLTRGKFTLIDDRDFCRVAAFKWFAQRNGNTFYAVRTIRVNGKNTLELMHRLFTDAERVDHRNGNGLDNRRSNLREASRSQNMQNSKKQIGTSSAFKGVTWNKQHERWWASIRANGERFFLGLFQEEIEAARAYDRAAKKFFGEFARINGV